MNFHILMWVVMILLILLSAFFSASEIAIVSFNKVKLKKKAGEGNKQAEKALKCASNYSRTISSILIGDTIVDLIIVYIITVLFIDLFGEEAAPKMETIFIALINLTFCGILPKVYAKEKADKFVMKTSKFLYYFIVLVYPLTAGFLWIKKIINKYLSKDKKEENMTKDDLKYIINEIENQGGIKKEESELAHMALDFDEITVEKILTPRVDIVAIEENETIENIKKILMTEKFSRVPVYNKTLDNIVGILIERDFFKNQILNEEFNIKENIHAPLFVPRLLKISDLCKELQRKKTHMAIVVDEHGGTLGLVTMEDVVGELVGEIWDEYDRIEQNIVKIDDNIYEVKGSMKVKDIMEYFNFSTKHFESEGNTVGGWAAEQLHKILEEGDSFEYKNMVVTIKDIIDQRVTKVEIKIKDQKEDKQ